MQSSQPTSQVAESPAPGGLWPLETTPLEYLFLADETSDYPMNFVLQLDFRGHLDRQRFVRAWEAALADHPLLQANVREEGSGRPRWVAAAQPVPFLDWAEGDAPLTCPRQQRIDLRSEIGLRLWVRLTEDRSRLMVHIHHACCDGVGGIVLVGDFLVAYDALCRDASTTPLPRPYRPELLANRGLAPPASAGRSLAAETGNAGDGAMESLAAHQQTSWQELKMVLGFWLRHPRPVEPAHRQPVGRWRLGRRHVAKNGAAPREFPLFLTETLDQAQLLALRHAATRQNATLNDLLVSRMFLTLDAWNRRYGRPHPERYLRLNVPVNLRDRSHEFMSAANIMSYSFLDRRGAECQDAQALLSGIARETRSMQGRNRSTEFLHGLTIAARFPRLLRRGLRLPRCLSTAVLAYMGDPTRRTFARLGRLHGKTVAGDVILERTIGCPPIRPRTRVALTANTYSGELSMGLRCDPLFFSADEAQALLNEFTAGLRGTKVSGTDLPIGS
jgi:hypothetical protein